MFTPGGQVDHTTFAGLRKGGKGGGSSLSPWQQYLASQQTATDPVTGKQFTSNPMRPGPSAQDQLNAEIDQRNADAKTASDAAAAQATQTAATNESNFQTNKTNAYNQAMSDALAAFRGAGVDPGQATDPNSYLNKYINPALNRQQMQIQDLDPNPMASYPTGLAQQILGTATGDKRTAAQNTLNQTFTPGYSSTQLSDTLPQQYISQILSEQFDPLSAQLTNAQKRGTLTDVGYQGALDALNQKKSAATDTLTNLGQNILSTDRTNLDNLISGAKTDVANLGLADTFDPTSYTRRASDLVSQDVSGFGGALRNAVGNTTFADITDLLNAGGAVQGANNPTAANPVGTTSAGGTSLTPDQQAAQEANKRGLGNVGAF